MKNEKIKISDKKLSLIKKANFHDLRSVLNQLQNYDKLDIFFDENTFNILIDPKKNYNYLIKITKIIDIKSVFVFFFNHLYENFFHVIDETIVYDMKLLLVTNESLEYFVNKHVPKLIKKLNF